MEWFKTLKRWYAQNPRRQTWIDLLAITLVCLPLFLVVVATITPPIDKLGQDVTWHLNRAQLIWQGVVDSVGFVYQVMYSALVGLVALLTRDVVLAAMLVNLLSLYSVVIGTYWLGRVLYNRPIAVLSAILISLHTGLFTGARLLMPTAFFVSVIVWCLVVFLRMIRFPGYGAAAVLGCLLVIATYTRIEGGVYAILIPAAAWLIYRNAHRRSLSLRMFLVSAVIFGAGALFYIITILQGSQIGEGNAISLAEILATIPVRWEVFSRRFVDLLELMLANWPLWCWWLVLFYLAWENPSFQSSDRLLATLILYIAFYAFLLVIWPNNPSYTLSFVPFFALLLAAAAWRIGQVRNLRLLSAVAVGAAIWPGLVSLASYRESPLFAYRGFETAAEGKMLDAWLEEHGMQDREIYTLCSEIPLFSRARFHLVHRLALRDLNSDDWWNSPARLLPYLQENDRLFMGCAQPAYYADWSAFLSRPNMYIERLEEVGRVGQYVFYRVVNAR